MKKFPHTNHQNSKGLTLVELMVAMTVGLFLVGGIISLLIGSRQSYRTTNATAEVQETGRFVTDYLANEFRQAGNIGCQRLLRMYYTAEDGTLETNIQNIVNKEKSIVNDRGFWLLDYENAKWLEGFDGTGSDFIPASPTDKDGILYSGVKIKDIPDVDTSQDVIVSRRIVEPVQRTNRISGYDLGNTTITIGIDTDTNNGFNEGDIAMVTTCNAAGVFQVMNEKPTDDGYLSYAENGDSEPGNIAATVDFTNVVESASPPPGSPTPSDLNKYGEAYRLSTTIFYIKDPGTGPEPALFAKSGTGSVGGQISWANGDSIAEQVYLFQILYGINSKAVGTNANNPEPEIQAYVPANQLATELGDKDAAERWDMVNAVRFVFVVGSSENNVVDSPMSITLPESGGADTFDATDRRYYQAFSVTVFIRNQLPWRPLGTGS